LQIVSSQVAAHIRATVAVNLDAAIDTKGLTNRALGEKIGSTEHQVWRWRHGKHMPSIETLAALADELFDGDVSRFYVAPDPTEQAA
jgi:transcriptional regulator with XRE-family HTH domain